MKKLFLWCALTLPAIALAAEPSVVEIVRSIRFHVQEADRLELQAHELLTAPGADPGNTFLDTTVPESSATDPIIAKRHALAEKDAKRLMRKAREHRRIASDLDDGLENIQARLKTSQTPSR